MPRGRMTKGPRAESNRCDDPDFSDQGRATSSRNVDLSDVNQKPSGALNENPDALETRLVLGVRFAPEAAVNRSADYWPLCPNKQTFDADETQESDAHSEDHDFSRRATFPAARPAGATSTARRLARSSST